MGKDKILELMKAYKGDRTVRFVLKGFNGKGTINDGLKWLLDMAKSLDPAPNITLDPYLYRKYNVTLAPTMLLEQVEKPKIRMTDPIPKEIVSTLGSIARANGMDLNQSLTQINEEAKVQKPKRYPALIVTGVTSRSWAITKAQNEEEPFDQGVQGQAYAVVEKDIEEVAKERITNIDWEEKKLAALERFWDNQEKNYTELPRAVENRERIVDPTIVLNRDVYGADGSVLYRKGQTFNPFDTMPFEPTLIVFNASKKKEIEAVEKLLDEERQKNHRVILIASEFAPSKALDQIRKINDDWKENIYLLTPEIRERFSIRATPTVVRADNEKKVFRIKEINLVIDEE